MTMRIEDFEVHIGEKGYTVEVVEGADGISYSVVRQVQLPRGALAGKYCDIAIQRDQTVPYLPPPVIHTRPFLVPMDMNGPLRTQNSAIGPDWQYWSRRFDRRPEPWSLWAHILTVLCDDRWPTK